LITEAAPPRDQNPVIKTLETTPWPRFGGLDHGSHAAVTEATPRSRKPRRDHGSRAAAIRAGAPTT
jgi:hypothetical protein